MKKKLLLAAASVCILAFLTGCSQGTYSKYVKLGDYKGLDLKMIKSEVTDEMVDEEIETLLEENASYTEITDRAAQEGDTVNVDFTGTIDGEEFEDGSAEDFDLDLGAGYFLDDFEAQLVGANAGETKELTVVFPEEYDETLAGKEAKFTVKVNSISEKSIPEYNDAFVSSISDYSTTAEYEDSLKAELLASQQENNQYTAGTDALQMAMDNATIDGYPQELYDECKAQYDDMNQQYADMFGVDVSEMEMDEEETKSSIESMVKEQMVSVTIAEKEKLKVSDEEYTQYLEDNYEIYGYDSAAAYEEAYTKDAIMKEILLLKVQDFLVENANITEVTEDEYYGDDEEYLDDEDVDMEDLGDDVEGALEDGDEDADEADTDDASETETETPEISETDSNAE